MGEQLEGSGDHRLGVARWATQELLATETIRSQDGAYREPYTTAFDVDSSPVDVRMPLEAGWMMSV